MVMRFDRPIIEMPRLIDVRPKALHDIGLTLGRLNLYGKALVITGPRTKKIAADHLIEHLDDTEYSVDMLISDESSISEANRAIDEIKDIKANFVLAIGGGTKIDVAKYASFKSKIPFISIPTVASHDGIASARASLHGMTTKHSFEAQSPLAVIGDAEIIAKAPRRYMISGCADIISNKTAVLDWQFSNRLTGEHISGYALTLSELIATTMIESKEVIAKGDRIHAAYTVLKGLITSSMSMCIAGSSRPASGAEHMISHRIDHFAEGTGLHGEQTGLCSIVSMYLHGGDWQEIKEVLTYIGAPITTKEINISADQMIEALMTAHEIRKERFTILANGITREAAEQALEKTGVIN